MHGSNMVLWGMNGRRSSTRGHAIKPARVEQAMRAQKEIPLGLIVYSLSDCVPCAIVKSGFDILANDQTLKLNGLEIYYCSIERTNKKELGKAVLGGIKSFPTIKLVVAGIVQNSYTSVPDGWDGAEVAHFLSNAIDEARRSVKSKALV